MSKRDPRQLRTQQHLLDAVFELGETRDLETLTITEITRAASIDRGTFYLHYPDKAAFLDKIATSLIQELKDVTSGLEDPEIYVNRDLDPKTIPSLYKAVGMHPGLFKQLLDRSGTTNFSARLQAEMEVRLVNMFRVAGSRAYRSQMPVELRARFAAGGLLGLLSRWLEEGNEDEIEQYRWWTWELLGALGLKVPAALMASFPERFTGAEWSRPSW